MSTNNIFHSQLNTILVTNENFELAYNYYYLKAIYNLINIYSCKYYWLNPIQEFSMLSMGQINTIINETKYPNNNKYIEDMGKNLLSLGEDIIQNGMYVPFFFLKEDNLLLWGKHRFYSLLQTNSKNEFLFIDLKPFKTHFFKKEFSLICEQFKEFSELISNNIFIYRKYLKPHKIFNNKILWENFINSPFQEI